MGAGFRQIYTIVVLVGTVAATDLATDATHVARRLEATEQVLTASDSAVLATELTLTHCETCADVIVLSDGTYTHTQTFVIDRDVTLRAQNQHGAILDGDNKRQVIKIEGSPAVVIEGLAITKGSGFSGGGMAINGGVVTVEQTTISGNTAQYNGGGIAIFDGTVSVVSSQINNNQASARGGGVYITGGTSTFTSCEISSNTADGVSAEGGGGVYIHGGTSTFTSCHISSNTADYAIIGTGVNTLGNGGGMYIFNAQVTVTDSQISGNAASSNGGGVYVAHTTSALVLTTVSFVLTTVLLNSALNYHEFYKSNSATVTVDSPSVPRTTCDAGTFLNTTTATCQISSPCSTAVSTEVVASPSTPAEPPSGLHIEDPNAKIMFGQGPNCTIQLDAGKLVSSCQIMEPNSGRRLQEHTAEVSSLTTENDALKAKIALLEAAK